MLVIERIRIIDKSKLIRVAAKPPDEIAVVHIDFRDLINVPVRYDNVSIVIFFDGVGMNVINGSRREIYHACLPKHSRDRSCAIRKQDDRRHQIPGSPFQLHSHAGYKPG